jgi:hypothetical protein
MSLNVVPKIVWGATSVRLQLFMVVYLIGRKMKRKCFDLFCIGTEESCAARQNPVPEAGSEKLSMKSGGGVVGLYRWCGGDTEGSEVYLRCIRQRNATAVVP